MPTLFSICAQQRRRGGAFDADAADYFARAEALGGSFDQTAINATYTEAYVKGAISDCIAALKTDAVWDKITELYLLAGVSFAGLMAKVKHAGTAVTTNVGPFVAGDYLAAGTGAGLKGNGSSKYLATSILPDSTIHESGSLGFYRTDNVAPETSQTIMGARDGSLVVIQEGTVNRYFHQIVVNQVTDVANYHGIHIASRISTTDQRAFENGTQVGAAITTAATSASNSNDYYIFAQNRLTGGATSYTSARISAAHIGTGLTSTEAANLSLRINGLMTALGCNVYNNP